MQAESQSEVTEKYRATGAGVIVPFDVRRDVQIQTLNSFKEMASFFREIAETAFAAGMVPNGIRNVEGALTAIWRGAEVGLLPQQALQSIFIVNGMPQLFGDAPVGIVEASGLLEDRKEFEEGNFPEDDYKWICLVKRRGHSEARTSTFSVADAKTAKLWGKTSDKGVPSPWVLYPKRMLLWRARGYALRDEFPDVLKGFPIRELMDDEDALFAAARPAVGTVVEPNLPKPEEVAEPPKRGRGRPPKAPPEAPENAQAAPPEVPKVETAPAPEPAPKAEPKATQANHEVTHGVKGPGGLFDFGKSGPAPKPEPPKPSGPRAEVDAKLKEAGFVQRDFCYLLAYAGLLGDKVDAAQIETGTVNLGNVPESALKDALADWADVLKALKQKPWERAHDNH